MGERMHPVVKLGIAGGLGYLAYRLLGFGFGGRGFGRGAGAADVSRDEHRLALFIRPNAGDTATEIKLDGQIVTVDEAIARVLAGGRDDVEIVASGAAREGDVAAITAALAARLKVSTRNIASAPISP